MNLKCGMHYVTNHCKHNLIPTAHISCVYELDREERREYRYTF